MPELAEVEYMRRQWDPGLDQPILRVKLHPGAAVFRKVSPAQLRRALTGTTLVSSAATAKQMLFRTSAGGWLGIHLGMTGRLAVEPAGYRPRPADHLVLEQPGLSLVFSDPRMFGLVLFDTGESPPRWWTAIAPPILSSRFTAAAVAEFLRRRARAPIKAVLLMQERFPGIGNWMADEILWRAEIHPRRPAGSLDSGEIARLHREARWVCREALRTIGRTCEDPPASWLFPHRWEDGGRCPRTGAELMREQIGGRTACWSPARQKL